METRTTPMEVTADRAEIDRLDEALIALVEERRAVSARIQQTRIADGGPRVDHAREKAIFQRYDSSFGRAGAAIASQLLLICRGR